MTGAWADALIARAGSLYLGALVGGFALVALWETWRPRRRGGEARLVSRWTANIGLLAINQTLLQWTLPLMGLAAAIEAAARGWGLLPRLSLPGWAQVVAALLLLDALRWALHRAFHHWPALWRLHRVHHSDLDYDCTIGLRFHPLEALLTQIALVAAILLLGLPPAAVLLSDLLTIAHGYVAHGNVGLPARVDAWLRRVIVTPDSHRVHHSTRLEESKSNFGSVLSLWDRLAGTSCTAPVGGHEGMCIGLDELRDPRQLVLWRLLLLPWRRPRPGDDGGTAATE